VRPRRVGATSPRTPEAARRQIPNGGWAVFGFRYAALALVAYMSTYSCPDNRMTSVITESVTARST